MSVSYYLLAKTGKAVHVYQLPDNCEHLRSDYRELIESISEGVSKADDLIEMVGDELAHLQIKTGVTGDDLGALAEIVKSTRGILTEAKVRGDSLEVTVETYSPEIFLAGIVFAGKLMHWKYASKTLYVALMVWAVSQLYEDVVVLSENEYDEFRENPTKVWRDAEIIIEKGKL